MWCRLIIMSKEGTMWVLNIWFYLKNNGGGGGVTAVWGMFPLVELVCLFVMHPNISVCVCVCSSVFSDQWVWGRRLHHPNCSMLWFFSAGALVQRVYLHLTSRELDSISSRSFIIYSSRGQIIFTINRLTCDRPEPQRSPDGTFISFHICVSLQNSNLNVLLVYDKKRL